MDSKICETPITGNFLADHLKKSLGPNAVLKAIKEAKRIAVGQGYVSHILRLELEWEKDQGDLPRTVIVKVPVVESLHKLMETMHQGDAGEQMKAMMAQVVTDVHKCECDFYHLIGKEPPIKAPKCYVALPVTDESPGMIVLEDLSATAAISPSFIQGLSYPQIVAAAKEVARLHAWSLTTKVDWRSKIVEFKDREPLMRQFLAPMAAGIKNTKEQYPEQFGSLDLEKVGQYLSYEAYERMAIENRSITDDVLMHGDYHMMNLLYKKKADGTVGDELAALIDFQAVLRGSPAFDLGRLMAFSVCWKVRREHTDDILHAYYDEIKSIAGDKFKATFDQYRQLYDTVFALTSVSMIGSIPSLYHVMIKSEGEQKAKDEKDIFERAVKNYEDAVKILGI